MWLFQILGRGPFSVKILGRGPFSVKRVLSRFRVYTNFDDTIVQSMSRKGNCIDNAATEQLFGHVKDEFYRGREWDSFEDFKRDLEVVSRKLV